MFTLLIDTHYLDITLVIYKDGKALEKMVKTTNLDHSMFIIPMLQKLLEVCHISTDDVKQIIVINGPGSFTGVRLGVTIGKTFAYLKDIPLYAISYLEAMAVSHPILSEVTPVIADKNGYFVASFDKSMNLTSSYEYISKHDFASWKESKNILEDVSIIYENVYSYVLKNKKRIHPHELKPLYIKKIEVQNG